jgi:hypothetical protein
MCKNNIQCRFQMRNPSVPAGTVLPRKSMRRFHGGLPPASSDGKNSGVVVSLVLRSKSQPVKIRATTDIVIGIFCCTPFAVSAYRRGSAESDRSKTIA